MNLFNYPLESQTVAVHRTVVSLTCGCVTKVTVAKCDRCVNIPSTFNGQCSVIKEFYSIIKQPTELCLHISPVYVIYISFPETVHLAQKLPVDCLTVKRPSQSNGVIAWYSINIHVALANDADTVLV
jgi:hypothetical protein